MTASPFPVLQTERLTLRLADPYNDMDCSILLDFYKDFPGMETMEDVQTKYIEKYVKQVDDAHFTLSPRPPGHFLFIYMKGDNMAEERILGFVGFGKGGHTPFPELGYVLLPEYRGRGYMAEAAQAAVGFWRDQIGVREMMLIIREGNQPSRRVAEKIGFSRQGTFTGLFEEKREVCGAYLLPGQQWRYEGQVIRVSP